MMQVVFKHVCMHTVHTQVQIDFMQVRREIKID